REHGISPGDIVGVIAGVARLPREIIGAIKLLPQQTLVDVSEEQAGFILQKLKGIQFKGQKLHASHASEVAERTPRGKPARSAPRKEVPPWARRRE
ncbi:MAG: DbpA RNA binding domain-containing protein, partial [Chthoniobacteraceae bacterium]